MESLKKFIEGGFGVKEDLSCSETIVYGANQVWNLGLDRKALKMAAGLSAGAYSGELCGVLSGGAMVLSVLYAKENAHSSEHSSQLVKNYIERFDTEMKSKVCTPLKDMYRTESEGCRPIIIKAAGFLDDIIQKEGLPAEFK